MSVFQFNQEQFSQASHQMKEINIQLANSMMELWLPIIGVRIYCLLKGSNLDNAMLSGYNSLKNQRKNVLQLKQTADQISELVSAAESKAKDVAIDAKNFEFYLGEGYGGNQGSPQIHSTELAGIVRKYYPNKSDKEVEDYLQELNENGCAYVAITNTVFEHFKDDPEGFQRTFGFPMTRPDGSLNQNELITDYYSSAGLHRGMNNSETGSTFEKYMGDHGISVSVRTDMPVTPENYGTYKKTGDIIVSTYPVIITSENGVLTKIEGGHAMFITGTTEDGRFIVSSWGKKYYLNPKDNFGRIGFSLVEYGGGNQ